MHQIVILVLCITSLNILETESTPVPVPDAKVTPLDILAKAKEYYKKAKSSLDIRKKEREKAMNCSDEFPCTGDLIKAVPEVCAGDEEDLSKCALKMFMKGKDLDAFGTPDWAVTVILFYKYLLEGAHTFALCSQYYNQSPNVIFFHKIRDACQDVSSYFFYIAQFMNDRLINGIIYALRPKHEVKKYSDKSYLTIPLERFYKLFPKTDPTYKDKTIHAIRNLYEYERYIESMRSDQSTPCWSLDDEDRLKCLLERRNELHENIVPTLQNLEFYFDSISCRSTLSLRPSLLSERPSLVLKTHKFQWESLSLINERLKTYSPDIFNQTIDILIEIEKLKIMAVAKYNGEVWKIEPDKTEAAHYEAAWGDGSSREDFVWEINV